MPRLQRLDHARKRVRARVCVRAGARQIDHTMHMPERGFREHTLAAMAELLAGLSERGLHVVTLSELDAMAASGGNANLEQAGGGAIPCVDHV